MHGQLFGGGFAAQFLLQLPLRPHQLVDRLDHVDRNADGASLVRNGARDRLAHPPGRVRRKLVAAPVVELIHRLHQADVAFLDQIQELQAAVGISLGDRDHQPQIGLDQLLLGDLGFLLAALHDLQRAAQLGGAGAPHSSSSCWIRWLQWRNSLRRSRVARACAVRRLFELALEARDFAFERPQLFDRARVACPPSVRRAPESELELRIRRET